MKKNLNFCVPAETTLLPFLLTCFSKKSRNYVKGILKRGQVVVDGKVCRDYSYGLKQGQQVEVLSEAVPVRKEKKLPVLYEDADIIVIDKPAGMLSVSTDKERNKTAYHMVYDEMKKRPQPGRIFVVHRLDRETSGVLLFAKSEPVKHALQEHWDELVLRRGYTAVVEGEVSTSEGKLSSWLKQTKTLLVYSSKKKGDGKLAITHYRTLQIANGYSLLDISLETGRKNQIRVHMHDMGHPVAGDKKYGAATDPFGRLALHASVLMIKHPSTGKEICLKSKTPGVFQNVFTNSEKQEVCK